MVLMLARWPGPVGSSARVLLAKAAPRWPPWQQPRWLSSEELGGLSRAWVSGSQALPAALLPSPLRGPSRSDGHRQGGTT